MRQISELHIGKHNYERLLLVDNRGTIDFGYLMDGMIKIGRDFYQLTDFKSFSTISDLKNKLEII